MAAMLCAHNLLVIFNIVQSFAAPVPRVAIVDGAPILKSEWEQEIDRQRIEGRVTGRESTGKDALDQLILNKLALKQAKKERLEVEPLVKQELDAVLLKHFFRKRQLKTGSGEPTEPEIQAAYQENPLVRVRHIVIMARDSEERTHALEKLGKLRKLVVEGAPFAELATEYTEDPMAAPGGDLDYRGLHNLHPSFYEAVQRIPPGSISEAIEKDGAFHLFQLVDRKPWENAPATYLGFLRQRLRKDSDVKFRQTVLDELKKSAKIKVLISEGEAR